MTENIIPQSSSEQQNRQQEIQDLISRMELQEKWIKFLEEQAIIAQADLEKMKHRLQQLRNQQND